MGAPDQAEVRSCGGCGKPMRYLGTLPQSGGKPAVIVFRCFGCNKVASDPSSERSTGYVVRTFGCDICAYAHIATLERRIILPGAQSAGMTRLAPRWAHFFSVLRASRETASRALLPRW
jgi:hypothetical protein